MNIGAYEAKTHLSTLLDRVAKGERFVITKHGVPVAVLQPPDPASTIDAKQAIAKLRRFRQDQRAKGLLATREEIREWIEEGRD
jgi:prevent-host-death family protein